MVSALAHLAEIAALTNQLALNPPAWKILLMPEGISTEQLQGRNQCLLAPVMLSNYPDNCQFTHGDTRKVEIVMEADALDQNEMDCDFNLSKTALGELWRLQASDNPFFVEDMVRNAAAILKMDPRVSSFSIRAVNHESIDDHNAFAAINH